MQGILDKTFGKFVSLSYMEKQNLFLCGPLFGFIIAAYTVVLELKYTIFFRYIGGDYFPIAKFISFICLLPLIFLDGYIVNKLKRHQIFSIYNFTFGVIAILFSFAILFYSTDNKCIAWGYFFYAEAFNPVVLGVFWSFTNSIHKADAAEKTYGLIVMFSKIWAVVITLMSYFLLKYLPLDHNWKISIVIVIVGCGLIANSIIVYSKRARFKQENIEQEEIAPKKNKTSIYEGITLIIKNSYVLKLFLLVVFADFFLEILNYQRVLITSNGNVNKHVQFLYMDLLLQQSKTQMIGFFASFLITNSLLRSIGIRYCIIFTPLISVAVIFLYVMTSSDILIIYLFIVAKAINVSVNIPVREGLYTVTDDDIRFKAKFAIETFGLKFARLGGQGVNMFTNLLSSNIGAGVASVFLKSSLMVISLLWFFTSNKSGKTFKSLSKNKE